MNITNFYNINIKKNSIDDLHSHQTDAKHTTNVCLYLTGAVAAHGCYRSPPVTLAFKPVVEINPLRRDTGPL